MNIWISHCSSLEIKKKSPRGHTVIWPSHVLKMSVNLSQFPYFVQRRGVLANNNGSLVLKVNTEAEMGARVTLFIEIP